METQDYVPFVLMLSDVWLSTIEKYLVLPRIREVGFLCAVVKLQNISYYRQQYKRT
jgi:hypothetical protein